MSEDDEAQRLVEQRLVRLSVLTELSGLASAVADPERSIDPLLHRVAERLGGVAVLLVREDASPTLVASAGLSRASRALSLAEWRGGDAPLPYPEVRREGLVRWCFELGPIGGVAHVLCFFTSSQIGSERYHGIADRVAKQLRVSLEHRQLVLDLRQSYRELEHAQRALLAQARLAAVGELAAAVAHEVRNPLGAIFNGLAALRRLVPPSEDSASLMRILGEESVRLSRIVDDLLHFARPPQLDRARQPLEPLLRSVVELACGTADGEEVPRIEVEITGPIGELELDAHQLRQALLNLVTNAVQASPRGEVVTVEARSASGGVEVLVRDRGPGIPDDVVDRIYEPFFTTKASGTGLGLAIVKRVVDAHEGRIAYERDPNGSTFRVWLPDA